MHEQMPTKMVQLDSESKWLVSGEEKSFGNNPDPMDWREIVSRIQLLWLNGFSGLMAVLLGSMS